MRITVFEEDQDPTVFRVSQTTRVVVRRPGVQGPAGAGAESLGDVNDLTTEDKSSIVSAINELNMDGVSLSNLYTNAKAG